MQNFNQTKITGQNARYLCCAKKCCKIQPNFQVPARKREILDIRIGVYFDLQQGLNE